MMTKISKRRLVSIAMFILSGLLMPVVAWGKKPGGDSGGGGGTSYTVARLDNGNGAFTGSEALDINDAGQVVGYLNSPGSYYVLAACWDVVGTQSQVIPLMDGVRAEGINNNSEIVGAGLDAEGQWRAKYWSSPTANPIVLPVDDGCFQSHSYAINDSGIIVGYSMHAVPDETGQLRPSNFPMAWRVNSTGSEPVIDGPVLLPLFAGSSEVYAVTECDAEGQAIVAGGYRLLNGPRSAAVTWLVQAEQDGTLSVAAVPEVLEDGNAVAYGISNLGVACGEGPIPSSTATTASLWAGGQILRLNSGRLATSRARDINVAGVTVGAGGPNLADLDAVVWPSPSASPVPLERYLPKRNSPFTFLIEAHALNESGTIVGVGGNVGERYGFIAVPN